MCSFVKSSGEKYFEIKDAYYQSWVLNENEKGTDVFIEAIHVKEGIVFDSIIFRGQSLPVFSEEKNGIVYLKSIINVGISKIQSESKATNLPDQLIYSYQGTKHNWILKNIRRGKMKYY
jgi:hypothetical protein